MTYYKIIVNSKIVGVATSSSFFRYLAAHFMIERTNLEQAEYIEASNRLYHAQWMQPIKTDLFTYEIADIIEIDEDEYITLETAVVNAPVEVVDEQAPIDIGAFSDPVDEITLEFVRDSKIAEMSSACHTTIEHGFDLELRNEIHHFSLDTQDQLNLITLSVMAQTEDVVPYHADGESCIFYTSEEIQQIVAMATQFKIYHTTYYNALKGYIKSLDTIEAIGAIVYGTPIPEEYKSDVLKALEV